jgi:hypothetical protein
MPGLSLSPVGKRAGNQMDGLRTLGGHYLGQFQIVLQVVLQGKNPDKFSFQVAGKSLFPVVQGIQAACKRTF